MKSKYFKLGFEKKAGIGSMLASGVGIASKIHTGVDIAGKAAKATKDIKGALPDTTKFFRGM